LATVLHLHRGTPYVYQGEELGMTNFPFQRIEELQDVESLNHYRRAVAGGRDPQDVMRGLRAMGRDNARTPVQWDGGPQAGFTTGTPWLAVNPNHTWLNAAAQYDDPDSVFEHYRRLIDLRHTHAVVREGDFTMLLPDDEHVYAFTRTLGREQLVVVANLSGATRTVDVDVVGTTVLLSTHRSDTDDDPDDDTVAGGGPLTLAPWQAQVRRRVL
jgi:oligo-1,6-glucosidase